MKKGLSAVIFGGTGAVGFVTIFLSRHSSILYYSPRTGIEFTVWCARLHRHGKKSKKKKSSPSKWRRTWTNCSKPRTGN